MPIVKVRLRKPYRVFTFLSTDTTLRANDACIVRTERGLEYGICVMRPEQASDEVERQITQSVVRKASASDETKFQRMLEDEEKARELCQRKIREHGLPMKLVDVECMFDHHKYLFYFTADDRVDFRNLVRDLAQELKMRIELRHIQVRDEAKLIGGLGPCGRRLCCCSFLNEFAPISMRMAKRQNLSLNPAKISGQCGRLMCCLGFENDQYDSKKKAKTDSTCQKTCPHMTESTDESDLDESFPVDELLDEQEEDFVELPDDSVEFESGDEPVNEKDIPSESGEKSGAVGTAQPRSKRRRRRRRKPRKPASG